MYLCHSSFVAPLLGTLGLILIVNRFSWFWFSRRNLFFFNYKETLLSVTCKKLPFHFNSVILAFKSSRDLTFVEEHFSSVEWHWFILVFNLLSVRKDCASHTKQLMITVFVKLSVWLTILHHRNVVKNTWYRKSIKDFLLIPQAFWTWATRD